MQPRLPPPLVLDKPQVVPQPIRDGCVDQLEPLLQQLLVVPQLRQRRIVDLAPLRVRVALAGGERH